MRILCVEFHGRNACATSSNSNHLHHRFNHPRGREFVVKFRVPQMRFVCSGYSLTLPPGRRFSAQRFARSRHQSQQISLLSCITGRQPVQLFKKMSESEQASSLNYGRLWRSL